MRRFKTNLLFSIVVFGIFITLILLRVFFIMKSDAKKVMIDEVGKTITVTGEVASEPESKSFTKVFILRTENSVLIRTATDKLTDVDYGDHVSATGKLNMPRNFGSNNGRVFDYIDYLGKDGIFYEFKKAEVKKANDKELGVMNFASVTKVLFALKKKFIENLERVLGEPHAALAGGLVVGEKASLGNDLINDFRRAGLIHIVVLSGYNITIIAASIRRMLSFLPKKISIILGAFGIVGFGIMVGGGATVVRSCIMAIIALISEISGKNYNVLRALIIAALLMLIQNPLILLYDPSFQLSFLASLGLIMLSSKVEKRLGFITEKFGMRGTVASTLATQIFVSPYILYMMGQLSIIGVFVNIIVLPFIPVTMLFVFLTGFVGFFSLAISQAIAWITHILLSYELFIVEESSALPFASLNLPTFPFWIVVTIYIIYFSLYFKSIYPSALTKFASIVSQFTFKKKSST